MKKQLKFSFKKMWFVVNSLLFAIAILSSLTGDDNTFGICGLLVIAMSYPLNMIVAWLFFVTGDLFVHPVAMLLMMFAMTAIGYVQWFKLMPRLAGFFSGKFARHDLNITLNVEARQMLSPAIENSSVNKWQARCYDEHDRTPLERVFASENSEDR
jgi:hypothetical protein